MEYRVVYHLHNSGIAHQIDVFVLALFPTVVSVFLAPTVNNMEDGRCGSNCLMLLICYTCDNPH